VRVNFPFLSLPPTKGGSIYKVLRLTINTALIICLLALGGTTKWPETEQGLFEQEAPSGQGFLILLRRRAAFRTLRVEVQILSPQPKALNEEERECYNAIGSCCLIL
jgi:hypothetical protein